MSTNFNNAFTIIHLAKEHLYLALKAATSIKVSEESKVLTFDDGEKSQRTPFTWWFSNGG